MKKTTAFTRKRQQAARAGLALPKKAKNAWQVAIARSSPFGDVHKGTAEELLSTIESLIGRLSTGQTPGDNTTDHDEIVHALATARIRAEHIGGEHNPAEPIFMDSLKALNRAAKQWEDTSTWGMPPEDTALLAESMAAYRVILMASSPLQMEQAWQEHVERLKETLEDDIVAA